MNYLKKFIIIMIIIVIIIVSCIIFLLGYKNKDNTKNIIVEGNPGENVEINIDKMEDVIDRGRFFTVEKCVQQYLDEINNNNARYFGRDENNNKTKIVTDEEINKNRYELLSSKFIKDNNITVNNVNDQIKTINSKLIFNALKMKYFKGETIENYVIYGINTTLKNQYIGELYIIVNLDRENQTFSVEPLEKIYNNIDEVQKIYNGDEIEKNENNSYKDINVTDEMTATEYFSIYKRIMLSKPEILYNYLQAEYRSKRFENIENFKKYQQENISEINQIQLQKYFINRSDEYTEIICVDQNQNFYIFDETNIMNFELKLDTYTLISNKFKRSYDSSSNEQKVALNIEKWIQMLNSRDYVNAYYMLDETFRNNNWKNQDEFGKYIKNKLPGYYTVEYDTYSNENNIYAQKIKVKNINNNEINATINVIMQLKDDYQFIMSFSIE